MPTYYGSNCDDNILTPECSLCVDSFELSGIGEAALIHKSYYSTIIADVDNATLWQTGYSTGLIKIIPNIRGDMDGGAPKYGPGYGRRANTYLGSEYKGKLIDANYIENAAFWESVQTTSNWHVAIKTQSQVHISKNPVTFGVKNPIAEDINKAMEWEVEYTWNQYGVLLPYTAPDGIFDCSFAS